MMINSLSLAFILAMIFWWGQQGIFSALLHLAGVIAAMVLSLATWDLLAHWMLGTETLLSHHAWGLALLAPFVLWMGLFRFAFSYLVPGNVFFSPMTNQVGGGALGAIAGVLVCGYTIIGLNFLPLPGDIGGYKPAVVSSDGRIQPNPEGGRLWVPFDEWTNSFLHTLSRGSMGTGRSLDEYVGPSLLDEAIRYRLATDYHEALLLNTPPQNVSLLEAWSFEGLASELLPPAARANLLAHQQPGEQHRLVWVRLNWTLSPINAGREAVLRLPPTQLALTARRGNGGGVEAIGPIGGILRTSPPIFYPNRGQTRRDILEATFAGRDAIQTDWLFLLPADMDPRFLRVRNIRFDLRQPDAQRLPEEATPQALAAHDPFTGLVNVHRDVADVAEMAATWQWSDGLPVTFSRNQHFTGTPRWEDDAFVSAPPQRAERPDRAGRGLELRRVGVHAGHRVARVELSPSDVRGLMLAEANSTRGAEPDHYWLEYQFEGDRRKTAPRAWFFQEDQIDGGRYRFAVESDIGGFQSVDDIPLRDAGEDNPFYLYFAVPEGGRPTAIGVRDQTAQQLGGPTGRGGGN